MATLRTRWLLSILLCSLQNCFAKAGLLAPLSAPECFIPCDEQNCQVDIECTWDSSWDPQIPSNYSLHWKQANSEEGHVTTEAIGHGSIHREHFSSHGPLDVWVEAETQHGSAKSQIVSFNTADIIKPPPPSITVSHLGPLEAEWSIKSSSICDQMQLSFGFCDIQNRTEANQDWFQTESGVLHTYTLDNPQPCTVYKFRVRCACAVSKKSDWSEIFEVWAESDPVGELDIWRDCGFSSAGFDCVVTWKKLPKSKACGLICQYEVELSYDNGTSTVLTLPTDGQSDQLVCDGIQCYLNSSLMDVSAVSVTAYNSLGPTAPAYLAWPIQGKDMDEQHFHIKMNKENLTVSWNSKSQLSDNLEKYVVQYKQAGCPPGQGFDWIVVNKNLTTGFFKGRFNISTPYNVSLFTVDNGNRIHHISSVIGYSLEQTPPRVPSFKVLSIAAHQVTLIWEPIPLSKQNGVIQCYQIGVVGQNVHNVSSSSHFFNLKTVTPGQEYEVWIRAVTSAGPGKNVTANFKTLTENNDGLKILTVVPVLCCLGVICVLIVVFWLWRGENKGCLLVPDPRNSHIFTNMKHQINDPLPLLCKPPFEPHPKIVVLEIVEMQPGPLKSQPKKTSNLNGLNLSIVGDERPQMDQKEDVVTKDCDRFKPRYEREEYSKMVDSDEEKDRETEDRDDCSNSSEEQQFMSGYEQHFMPTAVEILNF